MSQDYLFLYSIGPVQGYISQARKTIDLYAGSQMLSRLTKDAIDELLKYKKEYKIELILPYLYNTEQNDETKARNYPKIPNRFLAKVTTTDESKLRELAEGIKTYMYNQYEKRYPKVFIGCQEAQQQLKEFWETYWLFHPFDANNPTESYAEAENRMGAIKNLRSFKQIHPDGEQGKKCIVDGQRNQVISRRNREGEESIKEFEPISVQLLNKSLNKSDIKIWELGEGEGLSAPSFMKRTFLGHEQDIKDKLGEEYKNNPENALAHLFPSTARIALYHILNEVGGTNEFKEFEKKIKDKKGHSDDQLFYKENLKNDLNSEDLVKYFNAAFHKENYTFTKYYALLSFDGDSMGKWFSGANLLEQDKGKLLDFQKLLSQKLREFAKAATEMIEGKEENPQRIEKGRVVFSGEDFLAFINIHYLFEVMDELLKLWKEYITEGIYQNNRFSKPPDKILSFSAGILIAHYKEPLNWVLEQVRVAAAKAKEIKNPSHLDKIPEKNRFNIKVAKHSGSELECSYPFEVNSWSPLTSLDTIIQLLEQNAFSPTFILRLEKVLIPLAFNGRKKNSNSIPNALIQSEIITSVSRACNIEDKAQAKSQIDKLVDELNLLLDCEANIDNGNSIFVENFIQMLAICDFMYRRTK